MANSDVVRSNVNAAEIVDYWHTNVAPKYFNMDNVNTYRSGTLGYIDDIVATAMEDTAHAVMIARREFYPNTAQYTKSLYRHAASRQMDAPMAVPPVANMLLMIQQSDILRYGETDGDLHTFVLDDTFIAYVDDIPFMLDYPIKILSVPKSNGKYAHTTHYDFYIDNSLSTSPEKYLPNKTMNYQGTEYVIVQAQMRQIAKKYDSHVVTSNSIINTTTVDFKYSGDLANFEVFYKENDSKPRVQLLKKLRDSGISKQPFCWYELVDEETIRLTFPANAYFMPKLNSVVSIEIATTMGVAGEFDSYASDIVSHNVSARYPYNGQVPVFGTVDGSSSGAKSLTAKEDLRQEVMRAYATNLTYISVNDIQMYFNTLMQGTTDRFKFVKKRDDAFIRLYGAFLLMKDSAGNVVPTNTLDIELDPLQSAQDFDIYATTVDRFIVKPGALFTYKQAEDAERFVLRRIHNTKLSDDLNDYDDGGHYVCSQCGYEYDDFDIRPFSQLDDDWTCPECNASKSDFVSDKFVFLNPYLISVSTDDFMAGYFLNSTTRFHSLSYKTVNDDSIVQFIARNFKVERNAVAGENFYRFSVAVSPSVDSLDQDTIFRDNEDDIRTALHNGYVESITLTGGRVQAHIVYTDDPTISGDIPEDEKDETIPVQSTVTKVDQNFYVCPTCGHRYTYEEYEAFKAAGFVDEDGNPLLCEYCDESTPTPVEDAVDTYVDYDYDPGYTMKFNVGDTLTKNDVVATRKPTDMGRIRIMLDLGGVMSANAHRYIPMTLEAGYDDTSTYYIFAAYIATTDLIDSNHIMEITDGYVKTDGSDGSNAPISIPIEGLGMNLHTFYQYREDDGLEEADNPAHDYSGYNYVSLHTFTNTYTLHENDSISLIKSLDHMRGFLDTIERPETEDESSGTQQFPDLGSPDDEESAVSDDLPTGHSAYGENFLFRLRNCPMVSANWIKSGDNERYFIDRILEHYDQIDDVMLDLENAFSIDMKFYNSYGKSKFYKIGSSTNLQTLDSVNVTFSFGFGINFPASADVFRENFRGWLQSNVEATDEMVGNGTDLYIMNLISAAKTNFGEIGYMEYYGVNGYDYSAQRITVMSDEEILETVKADSFVPEFLNLVRETVGGVNRPRVHMTIEVIETN